MATGIVSNCLGILKFNFLGDSSENYSQYFRKSNYKRSVTDRVISTRAYR